jgi:hypothetical protein
MGTTVTPNETLKTLPTATFDKIRSYAELIGQSKTSFWVNGTQRLATDNSTNPGL